MIGGLIAYLLALACGGAFYIFYPGYLSFYALALLLVLPVLALLLALLSCRGLRLTAEADRDQVLRGEAACVRLYLHGPQGAAAILRYRVENLLYPQFTTEGRVKLYAGLFTSLDLPGGHCGWLRFTPLSCRVHGWLGMVSLPLALPEPTLVLMAPRGGLLPGRLELAVPAGRPLRPRPGGGPGEDFELRSYRPGDPVKAIHWKLSAKRPGQEPVLRETLEPVEERLWVLYDHAGPPEELDDVLDQLEGMAGYLLERERSFRLHWVHPTTGEVTRYEVDCPNAWAACRGAILAQAAPLSAPERTGHASPAVGESAVTWLRLTPGTGKEVEPL